LLLVIVRKPTYVIIV